MTNYQRRYTSTLIKLNVYIFQTLVAVRHFFFPLLFKIRECLRGESHSRAIFNLIFLKKEKKKKQIVSFFRREHNFHMRIFFYIPMLKSLISVTLLPTSSDYFLFLDNRVENRPSNPFILHHSLSC